MSLQPLEFGILALLTTSACGAGQVVPERACQKPGTSVEAPTPQELAALAGQYEVTMVNSEGEDGDAPVSGTLLLWANDSVRRFMPRTIGRRSGERPLAGRFESRSTMVSSYPDHSVPASQKDPAVEMVEATIYLGGLEYSDAGGDRLEVKQITSNGFIGVWTQDGGFSFTVDSASGRVVREPSGHFCARRVPQA